MSAILKEVPLDPEQLLNEAQAAEFLGLSVHTLRRWRNQRLHLPTYYLASNVVRYKRKDLIAFTDSRCVAV